MGPTGCPEDGIGAFQRVRYFDGMLLGTDDLVQEQTYFQAKLRRHNRMLHGWGIVAGLEVTAGSDGGQVTVAPGYGLDPCGNEVVIEAPVVVAVTDQDMFLGARFEEHQLHESRTQDSFTVQLLSDLGEPWIALAKVVVDPQGVTVIDSSVRRDLRVG